MKITTQNYYSLEANKAFFNVSQIKMYLECPKQWKGFIEGRWKQEDKDVFFHGHYVDCALTEPKKFVGFVQKHWDRISDWKGKDKLMVYKHLDQAILLAKHQPLFMKYLEGDQQEIIALDNFHGYPFRCRLDVINLRLLRIVDLKTARSIREEAWCEKRKAKLGFIDLWDYWIQMACYREAARIAYGVNFEGYIAALEKKAPYDHDVFHLKDRDALQGALWRAIGCMREMTDLLSVDSADVDGCDKCEFCIANRYLTEPKEYKPSPKAFIHY